MKRSPELRDLSEEHHYGLVAARTLRLAAAGASENLERAMAAFRAEWEREILPHFEAEEAVLLPAFAQAAGEEHPLIARTLAEHRALREAVARMDESGRAAEVAAALHDHIRFEERVLFPAVEEALAGERLLDLGARLQEREQARHSCPRLPGSAAPEC